MPEVQQAAGAVGKAVGKGVEALSDVEKRSPDEIASELRKATPQVAWSLNQTSFHLAEQLADLGAQAAALVNRTGHRLAESIAGTDRVGFDLLPGLKSSGRIAGAAFSLFLMVLLLCGVCMGTLVKSRLPVRRPPGVLQ